MMEGSVTSGLNLRQCPKYYRRHKDFRGVETFTLREVSRVRKYNGTRECLVKVVVSIVLVSSREAECPESEHMPKWSF